MRTSVLKLSSVAILATLLLATLLLDSLANSPALAAEPLTKAAAQRLFAREVEPLLKAKCLACHGDDKDLQGGLDLRSREAMLKGGESGEPSLVPGQPERSPLYEAVTRKNPDLLMPPKEADKLTAAQVESLRQWIAAGAPWADASAAGWTEADGVRVATSGGRSADWTGRLYQPEALWAYQPIRKPAVPAKVIDAAAVQNPIDAFIQARLAEKGIARVAPAVDKATLVRRLTFDLTGLPPTPDEVTAFAEDGSPDAYARLVARLLDSPRYAEQQARHWLDVVRYADTSGFSNDFERPNAWRYRDYVIRSFAADKPFDRFVLEQVAGDELGEADPELQIAVGFLRMGPWEHTGMSVAAVTRQQFLDDVTHHVGVTLLGQGLRCAACHDHKFDPVPTRDYYRIQACFAPTQFAEKKLAFLPGENLGDVAAASTRVKSRLDAARRTQVELRKKSEQAIAEFLAKRGLKSADELPQDERPRRNHFGLTEQELTIQKVSQKRGDYFERELRRFEPYAFTVYSGPPNDYSSNKLDNQVRPQQAEVPVVCILPGGALDSPADPVTPGVLSAVAGSNSMAAPSPWNTVPEATAGRRLALARWIASPQNTLTARVIVNRVWQQHFGRGLVATPNNFGKMGARPTHPELLDWLATWFIEQGWSLKELHTLIVSSATYQQGGLHPDAKRLAEIDAKNELWAYYPARRLAAEELRDSMLALTGELNGAMGGPGAFPEINWEVAFQPRHIMGSVAPAYQPSPTPAERNRRTIYAFRYRTLSDPLLEVFNRPGSEISCECRDQTTVAPQAFALMNSQFVQHRAVALAVRVEKEANASPDRLAAIFGLVYGRRPTEGEQSLCLAHVEKLTAHHEKHPATKSPLPTRIERHMIEELTGASVHWEEELDGLVNYQRDLLPADVSPATRAWADLCLVLLNSNEFLYVR